VTDVRLILKSQTFTTYERDNSKDFGISSLDP
jgi:hypothetical protein